MSVATELVKLENNRQDIVSAINDKGGSLASNAGLSLCSDAIRLLPSGTDTSDATATASDVLAGKTAYIANGKVDGTLQIIGYYTGEDEPDDSLGSNNDIYIMIASEPSTTYQMTYSLVGCSLSNKPSSVSAGDSFETVITVSDNYTLQETVVTMGGINVTSSAYNSATSTISIANVTGNVVIVVTCRHNEIVIDDEVGSVSDTNNSVTLNSSLGSGTYTLYYEDVNKTKLTDYDAIGTIQQ